MALVKVGPNNTTNAPNVGVTYRRHSYERETLLILRPVVLRCTNVGTDLYRVCRKLKILFPFDKQPMNGAQQKAARDNSGVGGHLVGKSLVKEFVAVIGACS
jgi:hypothetical protein